LQLESQASLSYVYHLKTVHSAGPASNCINVSLDIFVTLI